MALGDLAEIVRVLDSEGIEVADLRVHAPTLDDVFLAKTGRSLEGAADHGTGARRRRDAHRACHGVNAALATQVGALARRSMLKTLRQPFQMFPVVFFPAMLLAVNASGLRAATRLPGFPTSSYISFAIAVAFIQGGMFSLINTGTNLAEDIESGFFNRLALTPMRRVSLIAGMLARSGRARRAAIGHICRSRRHRRRSRRRGRVGRAGADRARRARRDAASGRSAAWRR